MFELLQNVIISATRETTELRDRVYALFGLALDAEELSIRPDYSKPRIEVYATTTMSLIGKHGLTVLEYRKAEESDERSQEQLPSWSLDFTRFFRAPLQQS